MTCMGTIGKVRPPRRNRPAKRSRRPIHRYQALLQGGAEPVAEGVRGAGDAGAVHDVGNGGGHGVAEHGSAGEVFGVADVGREPPSPKRHACREVLEDGMQRYLSFLVALADDDDGVDDGVDVVAFDGGDLADPQAGVGGEQDHRPGPAVHPGVEQDRQVLVGDRPRPALLDLRGGRDGGGVVGAAAGDDEPLAPGPDRAVVVGPGGLGPGGRGQEPVHALRGDCGGVGDPPDDGEPVGDGLVGHAAATLPEHPVLQ